MSGNAPKILIVVLVVVVVIFFVGVGMGARSDGEGNSLNDGGLDISVESVLSSFSGVIPGQPITLDEIDVSPSGCLDEATRRLIVPELGDCEIEIAASSAALRSLSLRIAAESRVHIAMEVYVTEDTPITFDRDFPEAGSTERDTKLDVFKERAVITIDQCVAENGSACVIDINR